MGGPPRDWERLNMQDCHAIVITMRSLSQVEEYFTLDGGGLEAA